MARPQKSEYEKGPLTRRTQNQKDSDIMTDISKKFTEQINKPIPEAILTQLTEFSDFLKEHRQAFEAYSKLIGEPDEEPSEIISQFDGLTDAEIYDGIFAGNDDASGRIQFQLDQLRNAINSYKAGQTAGEAVGNAFLEFAESITIGQYVEFYELRHPETIERDKAEPLDMSFKDSRASVYLPVSSSLKGFQKATDTLRHLTPAKINPERHDGKVSLPVQIKGGMTVTFEWPEKFYDSDPDFVLNIANLLNLISIQLLDMRNDHRDPGRLIRATTPSEGGGIFINARDYARLTITDENILNDKEQMKQRTKQAKKELIKICEYLFNTDVTFQDGTKAHILQLYKPETGGVTVVPVNFIGFKQHIVSRMVPADFFEFDSKHLTAQQVYNKLTFHSGMDQNIKRGTNNFLSIKSLLDEVPEIPSLEEVKASKRSRPVERIIQPLNRALIYLQDERGMIEFQYTDQKRSPITGEKLAKALKDYDQFSGLYILFKLTDGDNLARYEKKRKAIQKERRYKAVMNRRKKNPINGQN